MNLKKYFFVCFLILLFVFCPSANTEESYLIRENLKNGTSRQESGPSAVYGTCAHAWGRCRARPRRRPTVSAPPGSAGCRADWTHRKRSGRRWGGQPPGRRSVQPGRTPPSWTGISQWELCLMRDWPIEEVIGTSKDANKNTKCGFIWESIGKPSILFLFWWANYRMNTCLERHIDPFWVKKS